jgi:hypothetical protein
MRIFYQYEDEPSKCFVFIWFTVLVYWLWGVLLSCVRVLCVECISRSILDHIHVRCINNHCHNDMNNIERDTSVVYYQSNHMASTSALVVNRQCRYRSDKSSPTLSIPHPHMFLQHVSVSRAAGPVSSSLRSNAHHHPVPFALHIPMSVPDQTSGSVATSRISEGSSPAQRGLDVDQTHVRHPDLVLYRDICQAKVELELKCPYWIKFTIIYE